MKFDLDAAQEAAAIGEPLPAPARATPRIDASFHEPRVAPERMDDLWREGWRHFGGHFVRYSRRPWRGRMQVVQPLRVVLARNRPSKNQRRILSRNAYLMLRFQPVVLDDERARLFDLHAQRFAYDPPHLLQEFLGERPDLGPCQTIEVAAYKEGRLVAASYLDVGVEAVSSQYGIFHPSESRRSLGIATMLWEMAYARQQGCRYYYLGYAYHNPSELDYKKQFSGLEWFDWRGSWRPL